MKRWQCLASIWATALGCVLALTSGDALAQQWEKSDTLRDRAESAFWWGDFDEMERLYNEARKATTPRSDGLPQLYSVRAGFAAVFKYNNLTDSYFEELQRLTAQWASERPRSALAHLLHVRTLYARAWHHRGDGYAISIPQEGQKKYIQYIKAAEDYMAQHGWLAEQDSTAHVYLLMLGRSAGWSFKRMWAVAQAGASKNPADEDTIYEELAYSLLPKWGGSWQDIDALAEEAHQQTKARRGAELYAFIYSGIAYSVDGNLFEVTQAKWPRVKEGLKHLLDRTPAGPWQDRLAYLACLAHDRATFDDAMKRVEDRPDLDFWKGGGTGGRQNYESCISWAHSR